MTKKTKKILFVVVALAIVLVAVIVIFTIISNKPTPIEKSHSNDSFVAKTIQEELKQKYPNKEYLKLKNGEILNEEVSFSKYSFVSNNSIYIFNPEKLDNGIFEYKKVYDKNIKIMNIAPNSGADIIFYDYNDIRYTLHDDNIDNKVSNNYNMYEKANYNLSDYLKWEYSTEFLGNKIDYDFMSNYFYVKDNILYFKNYGNEKYPTIEKVSGNYEGEQVSRIHNERILKTDKAFYELMSYFDTNLNKTVTTTVKINMLTKYYDEVLTFTYKYVILKDYTIIPINDIMENRVREYSYDYFLSGFNYMNEVRYEE